MKRFWTPHRRRRECVCGGGGNNFENGLCPPPSNGPPIILSILRFGPTILKTFYAIAPPPVHFVAYRGGVRERLLPTCLVNFILSMLIVSLDIYFFIQIISNFKQLFFAFELINKVSCHMGTQLLIEIINARSTANVYYYGVSYARPGPLRMRRSTSRVLER